MKKFKYLLSLICVLCLFGCNLFGEKEEEDEGVPTISAPSVTIWGNIYDAATGADISGLTSSQITVTAIYGSTRKNCTVVVTPASDTAQASVVYYTEIPEDTFAKFEVKVTGYNDFWAFFEANQLTVSATIPVTEQGYVFFEKHTIQKDVPLFKTVTTTDFDQTFKLRAGTSASDMDILSSASGVYSLVLTTFPGINLRGKDFTNTDTYIGTGTTGTITNGTFTIAGSSFLPGAEYTLTVSGVEGYQNYQQTLVKGLQTTAGAGTVSTDTVTVLELTPIMNELAVAVIGQSWFNVDDSVKQGLTSVTLTFNQDVELHPANVANYVKLAEITGAVNSDGDGTTVDFTVTETANLLTPTGYSPTDPANTASNICSITHADGAKNVVTISVDTSLLNAETSDDNYSLIFYLDRLFVRAAGSEDTFVAALSGVSVTSVQNEVF